MIFQVSVVIPTRGRPEMLTAAVHSALGQTLPPFEILVIVDGPETAAMGSTADALERSGAHGSSVPVHVLELSSPVGGGAARNLGVQAARGEWIAFLDDDDTWLPEKLQVQCAEATGIAQGIEPVLSCSVIARSPDCDEVWPRVRYKPGQPMADYLFCRKGLRYGSSLLQTSTLLARRTLLERVPFTPGLKKHQDWDWLIRVAAEPDVVVSMAGAKPLVIFHIQGTRQSVSRSADWRFSLAWLRERQHLFSARAKVGFLTTECAAQAQRQSLTDRLSLLREVLQARGLRPLDCFRLMLFLGAPRRLRTSFVRWLQGRKQQTATGESLPLHAGLS